MDAAAAWNDNPTLRMGPYVMGFFALLSYSFLLPDSLVYSITNLRTV